MSLDMAKYLGGKIIPSKNQRSRPRGPEWGQSSQDAGQQVRRWPYAIWPLKSPSRQVSFCGVWDGMIVLPDISTLPLKP